MRSFPLVSVRGRAEGGGNFGNCGAAGLGGERAAEAAEPGGGGAGVRLGLGRLPGDPVRPGCSTLQRSRPSVLSELELNTKCVVEMEGNQTVLHPPPSNTKQGER